MASSSRSSIRLPSLRLHKASNQAVVTVRGRDIYCGRFGSPEADAQYKRICADLLANGPELLRLHGAAAFSGDTRQFVPPSGRVISVAELVLAYVEFAERHYRAPSRELEIVKRVAKALREEFGFLPASDFGPRCLKAIRQKRIDKGNARNYINAMTSRIVRMWKWASAEELIPASAWHQLQSVTGLRAGRSEAKETPPKEAVPEEIYRATLRHVGRVVAALLELLWLTGARSGELFPIRTCDIIRDTTPWQYCPIRHKNAHRGHKRVIFFGPRARAILAPFLNEEEPEAYLFSPAEAATEQKNAAKASHRSDTQRATAAANKRRLASRERVLKTGKSRPKSSRRPGLVYTRHSLGNAVRRVCKRHGIPHWHPHLLKHTVRVRLEMLTNPVAAAATRGELRASPEAQSALAHTNALMSARYGGVLYGLAAVTMEQHG